MLFLVPILVIVGGLLAISDIVVAKRPSVRPVLRKLLPYQAAIGVALFVGGGYFLVTWLLELGALFSMLRFLPLFTIAMFAMMATSVVLGFLLAVPDLTRRGAQSHAKLKLRELAHHLAPHQTWIALAGIAAGVVMLLYRLRILGSFVFSG